MIKKKAKVILPGSISSITNSVQEVPRTKVENYSEAEQQPMEGAAEAAEPQSAVPQSAAQELPPVRQDRHPSSVQEEIPAQPVARPVSPAPQPRLSGTTFGGHYQQPAPEPKDRTAPAAKKLPKAEGKQLAREYSMAKDSGEDSWQLFLDLARDYKQRDSKLATVYIDSDLKHILDRLKSSGSVKLPSTAILSAIVARFVFDHEQEVKDAIYGDSLL